MTDIPTPHQRYLFCFGLGYSALALARLLLPQGWRIGGTTTDTDKLAALRDCGIEAHLFDSNHPLIDAAATLHDVTHILLSIPPCADSDPAFAIHSDDIAALPHLQWLGYLSTTGVYGNRNGDWIDETATPAPTSRRGDNRLRAEEHWHALYLLTGLPLHRFRLSGIYGPGRSALDSVRAGTARRIDKPGHVFNRIHVDDIAQVLAASMAQPKPGAIYNLADDEPAPSSDVIAHACKLLDLPEPPLVDHMKANLAPMVQSFYKDNKRIRNDRIKQELGVSLLYPDYRAGLAACLLAEEDDTALASLMLHRCSDG